MCAISHVPYEYCLTEPKTLSFLFSVLLKYLIGKALGAIC